MEWNIKVTPKKLKESINYTANIKVARMNKLEED